MENGMRRIEKTLSVNMETLKAFGSYYDRIVLPDFDAYIALTVVAEKRVDKETCQIKSI